jgi:hypothetical protein
MSRPCTWTRQEDNIILQEVRRTPENVLFACCRAAARLTGDESLATLRGVAATHHPTIRRVYHRWYRHISVKDGESILATSKVCFLLHSEYKLGRNRKVQSREYEQLRIPIISSPPRFHRRASEALSDYLASHGTFR